MSKTRSKATNSGKPVNDSKKKVFGNKKIFFIEDNFFPKDEDKNELDIVALRNPQSNEKSMYLFAQSSKNLIYEIIEFNEPNRSWFINQSVSSNGRIYMITQIDPVFLFLHFIQKHCQSKALPLDHIFEDEEFPDTLRLLEIAQNNIDQVAMVSEIHTAGDVIAVKYNEAKTLNWLQKKCEKLEGILQQKRVHVGQGAVSATFIKSEKLEESVDNGEGLRYAHGIISDYLPEEISEKLAKFLNIPEETLGKKRKINSNDVPNKVKKIKVVDSDTDENKSLNETSFEKTEKIAEKKTSAKEKALAKAANGTKSIASFFTKKA